MIDNSTNAFTITAAGNTVPRIFNPFGYTAQTYASYTPTTHGGSAYFDGTGDYLTLTANSSFATGTGNFTIEGWIYVTDLSAIRSICGTRTIADTTTGWNLAVLTTGSMQIYDNTGYAATGAGSVVVNTWCHFAFVRQSNVFYSYINGIQKASTACTRDWTQNTFWVGINGGSSEPFLGYISNLRFVNSTAVYTSGFIPPTTSVTSTNNTVLLLNFNNGGIIDQHSTNVLETVGNTQLSTSVKKYNNSSIYFDGTGDYLASLDNSTLGFGSGAFTVEGWIYLNNTSGTKGIVFGRGNNSFGFRVGQSYLGNVNGLNIVKTGVADLDYCAFTFVTNTWYHIAVVRSGTTIYFFVNGTQQTTLGSGAGSFNYVNPTSGYYIGCNNDTNEQFAGYIDDLRITKGYARYTSNFTAPTSALITK
jgi:hypothetical protein